MRSNGDGANPIACSARCFGPYDTKAEPLDVAREIETHRRILLLMQLPLSSVETDDIGSIENENEVRNDDKRGRGKN